MGGSNPSLLKRSACLFFSSVVFGVMANEPYMVINAITNLTGGNLMETIHYFNAVFFATTQSATIIASSVMAGLVANGVTPHLY